MSGCFSLRKLATGTTQGSGRSATWIAAVLKVSRATVYRTERRFFAEREAGLFDRRDGNGIRKLTEESLLRCGTSFRNPMIPVPFAEHNEVIEALLLQCLEELLHERAGIQSTVATCRDARSSPVRRAPCPAWPRTSLTGSVPSASPVPAWGVCCRGFRSRSSVSRRVGPTPTGSRLRSIATNAGRGS